MFNSLALTYLADDFGFLIDPIDRNDQCNVLTDRLCRCLAKKSLGSSVPARNDSVEILANDHLIRGLNNCC